MKVRSSIKLKGAGSRFVKRKGKLYVISKIRKFRQRQG